MCVSMMGGMYKDAYGSWEDGIYGLPSSFEVVKSFPHVVPCLVLALCFAWN
jgi:hypothetical protein